MVISTVFQVKKENCQSQYDVLYHIVQPDIFLLEGFSGTQIIYLSKSSNIAVDSSRNTLSQVAIMHSSKSTNVPAVKCSLSRPTLLRTMSLLGSVKISTTHQITLLLFYNNTSQFTDWVDLPAVSLELVESHNISSESWWSRSIKQQKE